MGTNIGNIYSYIYGVSIKCFFAIDKLRYVKIELDSFRLRI